MDSNQPIKLSDLIRWSRDEVHLPQPEFAARVGTSKRTLMRWEYGQAFPKMEHLHAMARVVFPLNRDYASQLAAYGHQTLAGLGLELAPVQSGASTAVGGTRLTRAHLVDSVICAAAEAADLPPAKLRAALAAGLTRAEEVGLRLVDLRQELAPPKPT